MSQCPAQSHGGGANGLLPGMRSGPFAKRLRPAWQESHRSSVA